jgi:hypothetical protein
MGLFVTDNSTFDEDKTTGTIKVSNWLAIQMYITDNIGFSRPRVSIQEFTNGRWVERVRPNNANGLIGMLSFTVVNVRANYSIINGLVSSPTVRAIPVLKSQLVGRSDANVTNGPTIFWTLQIGGMVSYNTEMFRF